MKVFRFLVVGSGWRSLFYWRIACMYPECFQMTAMLCRTEEKAAYMRREYGIPAVCSEKECRAMKPDAVIVAVNRAGIYEVSRRWMEYGFPVLCETPAALSLEHLQELWRLRCEKGKKLQVAEQYFCYPSFSACIAIAETGKLGDPYAIALSAVHDYHAASLIRRLLRTGMEQVEIRGKEYFFPVEETASRYGIEQEGRVSRRGRTCLSLEFESGKAAFYDFDAIQYHSLIRSRHLRLQGEKGELDDAVLRWVDDKHQAHQETMREEREGGGIRRIWLGDKKLYENPFGAVVMPQDETAVACLLKGMQSYLETGTELYPLADALQDSYLGILMRQAAESGKPVKSIQQPWAE